MQLFAQKNASHRLKKFKSLTKRIKISTKKKSNTLTRKMQVIDQKQRKSQLTKNANNRPEKCKLLNKTMEIIDHKKCKPPINRMPVIDLKNVSSQPKNAINRSYRKTCKLSIENLKTPTILPGLYREFLYPTYEKQLVSTPTSSVLKKRVLHPLTPLIATRSNQLSSKTN